MAYNNRYQEPQTNNLNPARFAQNPTRMKSTRWTAAKTHNYDGDDWGDDDYDDEYGGDIYTSPYQQQQQQPPPSQNSRSSQYGNQDLSFNRSSTQPLSQISYSRQEPEDVPRPLARQGTSPAGPPNNQSYGSVGIQRKPSKMDRERAAQKPSHYEQEHVESPVAANPQPDPQSAISPAFYPPTSASQPSSFSPAATNEGYETPTKQPSSPAQSLKGSPTIRRPADIYAAAMRKSLEAPTISVDTGSSDASQPADNERPPTVEEPAATTAQMVSGGYNESTVFDAAASEPTPEPSVTSSVTPSVSVNVASPTEDSTTEEGNAAARDLPPRNSALFLDVNTDDDISRNIRLITPPPSQKSHFLMVPEPVQEPIQAAYDSSDDEEKLGLFHTSTPPRRQSLSPTSAAAEYGFHQAGFPVEPHDESPVETHPEPGVEIYGQSAVETPTAETHVEQQAEPLTESPVEAHANSQQEVLREAANVPVRSEAASPSEYGTHPPSSQGSPIDSSTPQTQSIGEKVSGATSMVSNAFSSLVTNAFGRDSDTEPKPQILRSESPAQQTREQTTSAPSFAAIFAGPETPSGAAAQAEDDHPSQPSQPFQPVQSAQPEIAPVPQLDIHISSREATPDRFDEEEEEATIEEAQTGAWGMATHVAIPQSQNQSPTKTTPTQSPLVTELSQPLITKASQPVIHTPQPTSSSIEQSAIIEVQSSDRAISPASHASSSAISKSPSLTTPVAPAQSSDRRSPQPISFAEFIKRSPQSTPTGVSSTPPMASSPPVASGSPGLSAPAPAAQTAPVSFKAFMTNRSNPMPEPERSTPPSSTPPAPSFRAFLSQKAPVSQPNAYEAEPAPTSQTVAETQPAPANQSVAEPHPSAASLVTEPQPIVPEETPVPEASTKVSPTSEGEALRQAILKRLDAESQPQTPDTPNDNIRNADNQFENHPTNSSIVGTEPNSPTIDRTPSYKGKMPQRTASLAVSDVSEDRYRPQPFENAQYPRYQKQASGKSYPPPPESDISAPSKSGDEGVFTPPAQSFVGEQQPEYEPSIQEERGYQPSITSEQFVPSPVDTVHPTKPFQMQRDFNEIPTLLNLSDILALSDAKDRIAASEKARKIHAQQGQQGTHDLQVWLHHVQQISHQNAQLWTYNSTKPGMHDLRSNPLVSGRFDLFAQQNRGDANKWKAWGRLDDGIAGSRPSTAATDDYMAPKPKATQLQGNQHQGVVQNQDRKFGSQPAHQNQSQIPNQQPQGQPPQVHDFAIKNPNQAAQINGAHAEAPKQEEPHEDKKKSGLGKKLRGILGGRKKDKAEAQPADTSSQPPTQAPPKQQQIPIQPVPLPQNEKYPPNIAQQGPQFVANGAPAPQNHTQQQQPPNKIDLPKQDAFLPPLSFQQGSKSPGLSAVMNIPNSNSVPDLRARSQNQQQKEDGSQKPSQGMPDQSGQQQALSGPPGPRRPNTADNQSPPPPRNFDEDAPPPLRRISTSKPPPPRKRISSIPPTVQEGGLAPSSFDHSQPPSRESQDNSVRPGTGSGYPPYAGAQQGPGPSHLRPQETSSGYEPSVISEASTTEQTSKKSRFSVFKIKNSSATPASSTAQGSGDNTGSPRHSVHTIGSQPSTTGERRSSSFFKKFDQLVVGKERANEFHQQQAQQQQLQNPPSNQNAAQQPGPDPGINRQQSFPTTDGSNSIQPTPENKKKGRFASLISDLKPADNHENKSRKPSIFSGGKGHQENNAVVQAQGGPAENQPQNLNTAYPPTNLQAAQSQVPVYNPDGNVVVPIPGQYYSVGQDSSIQSSNGYVNGNVPPQGQFAQGIPPPPGAPTQTAAVTRKASNPPPPAARFLAPPPSPPPVARKMNTGGAPPHEEESIYAPPVNTRTTPVYQSKNDGPPPLQPHQTSSPSPPPRIVYAPPEPPVSKAPPPVQSEIITPPVIEQPPTIQVPRYTEQENKVVSPITRAMEPEPPSFSVQSTGFVVADVITTPPPVESSPPPAIVHKVETPMEEPPRVEVTPATATEPEPPKLEASVPVTVEPTPITSESSASKEQETKEEPAQPKKEPAVQAESSTKPEAPKIMYAEDFDKIAVMPEGPVPETKKPEEDEDERIVMSATTTIGFNDWEYF